MFVTRRIPLLFLRPDDGAGDGQPTAVQPAPEGTPGAVEPTAAAAAQAQQEIDWQKRAHDAQAWGTQAAQEAAELRRERELYQTMVTAEDPDTRRQAAEALGFRVEDPEPDPFAAPDDELRRELADMKAWRDEVTTAGQQQAMFERDVTHIRDGLQALQTSLGRSLTEQEIQLLGDAAWQNRDEQGLPNITAVGEMYTAAIGDQSQAKPRPRAPHVPAGGEAATHVPTLDTSQQRSEYVAKRIAELAAEEQAGT